MHTPVDFREYFIEKYYDKNWLAVNSQRYATNNPFPYIVIDDFLPSDILDEVVDSFPAPGETLKIGTKFQSEWLEFANNNEMKLTSRQEVTIPQLVRSVLFELNSGYVLDWLQQLTGVSGLVADTRLIGGGMHQIKRGGKLGVHIDFNLEPITKLSRQLNLLLYLNKDWKPEYGGDLELWNPENTYCAQKIAPIFNRCVIFNTNGRSWHGHPHPLNTPEGITRKSLALYYYNVNVNFPESYRGTTFR